MTRWSTCVVLTFALAHSTSTEFNAYAESAAPSAPAFSPASQSGQGSSSDIPEYRPEKLSTARLTSVGSDTMGDLVEHWVESYKAYQPGVAIQVVNYGSASAPAALIEGTANLGHMVRPMKEAELEDFKLKYGFEPTQLKVALAAGAIYVAKNNPIRDINFTQLDAIYSSSRKRGAVQPIRTWGDLGVKGSLSSKAPMPLGIVDSSYAHTFFRQQVLLQGDFQHNVTATADTKSLIQAVAANDNAIGYASFTPGINTLLGNERVRLVPVSRAAGETASLPNEGSIKNGSYPLARSLNLYLVRQPGKSFDSVLQDFLRFVLSRQGQKVVVESGLIPLTSSAVNEELEKLRN